ncbi:FAD/NAD(P)-binding domain-containing protein [Mycena polygramma]|nr:FAD/NAD(P)-binding domain-containing protein [Mycena polygramma]
MTDSEDSPRPLSVTIVGAGVGGLSAAIALRRSGHHVRIYEASQTNVEIGAGISTQANALRILKQWGVSRESLRPVDFDGVSDQFRFEKRSGNGTSLVDFTTRRNSLCHRIDLHDALKRLALGEGEGPPAQLVLDSKVVGCDPESGTITLGKGDIIHADIVLGADGIHSVVRTSILGHVVNAVASGYSAFRCLLDASKLKAFPDLGWLTEGLHGARSVGSKEAAFRIFFLYPCRSGTLINFVGIHPDLDADAKGKANHGICSPRAETTADWTPDATRQDILEEYKDFDPTFLRILDLEPATPLLKWHLKFVPTLPTWIRGRAAILGDAAHGTLPILGQGAAMAIEEAATLGCLFPLGTTREDVPARLEAYQILRKARGEYVNTESVAQAAVPEKRGTYLRSREMQAAIIEHDATKVAQEYYDAHFSRRMKP